MIVPGVMVVVVILVGVVILLGVERWLMPIGVSSLSPERTLSCHYSPKSPKYLLLLDHKVF
jgi:hypothetical protein